MEMDERQIRQSDSKLRKNGRVEKYIDFGN
jgi:hypothetical protein